MTSPYQSSDLFPISTSSCCTVHLVVVYLHGEFPQHPVSKIKLLLLRRILAFQGRPTQACPSVGGRDCNGFAGSPWAPDWLLASWPRPSSPSSVPPPSPSFHSSLSQPHPSRFFSVLYNRTLFPTPRLPGSHLPAPCPGSHFFVQGQQNPGPRRACGTLPRPCLFP